MKQDDKRPPAIDASALMTHNTAGHSSITCTLRLTRGGSRIFYLESRNKCQWSEKKLPKTKTLLHICYRSQY